MNDARDSHQNLGIGKHFFFSSVYKGGSAGLPVYQDIATESLRCIYFLAVFPRDRPSVTADERIPLPCRMEEKRRRKNTPFLLSGDKVDPAGCPNTVAFTFRPPFPCAFTAATAGTVEAAAAATPVGGLTIWIADDGLDIIVQIS